MLCANCGVVLMANIQVPSFPVPDLIHTSRTPSQFDANIVRSTLSRVYDDISRIDDEIKRLHTAVNELACTREALYKYTKENEAILSPIGGLPPELLSEIFLLSLPPWPTPDASEDEAYIEAVLLPGHICSYWRKVALSTPKLYTSITVGRKRKFRKSEAALMDAWLLRTGSLPLSLHFRGSFSTSITNNPAMNVALHHSDRWEHLKLYCPASSIEKPGVIKGRLQCLETLNISLEDDIQIPTQPIDVFEFTPRLRSLHFWSDITPNLIKIPWAQLTDLKIQRSSHDRPDACLDVLDSCPNLVTCSLTWNPSQLAVQRPRIRLPHLRSLHVETYANASVLFDHLSLPALCNFEFWEDDDDVWANLQLNSLLTTTNRFLQRLVLEVAKFVSDEELICYLEYCPFLVELHLHAFSICEYPSTALARLTNYSSAKGLGQAACLAPKLRIIKLSHHPNFDDLAFANMIQSRWRLEEAAEDQNVPVERIKTVEIRLPSNSDDWTEGLGLEASKQLQEYKDEGLDITVFDDDNQRWLALGELRVS